MPDYVEPKLLLDSCKLLFDPQVTVSSEFLKYLHPAGLRAAYHDRIKASHPDRAHLLGMPEEQLTRLSQEINLAYDTLLLYIDRQKSGPHPTGDDSTIPEDHFYRGRVPKRKLRFAMFLYYTQTISWRTLVDALVWQRRHRPLIGQIAVAAEVLDRGDIATIIGQSKRDEAFGETAIRLNLLEDQELRALLGKQASYDCKIGQFFLATGTISAEQLSAHLWQFRLHNARFATAA